MQRKSLYTYIAAANLPNLYIILAIVCHLATSEQDWESSFFADYLQSCMPPQDKETGLFIWLPLMAEKVETPLLPTYNHVHESPI